MTTAASPAPGLPGLRRRRYVTDGGMETDLIFHHGVDLPEVESWRWGDTRGAGKETGDTAADF